MFWCPLIKILVLIPQQNKRKINHITSTKHSRKGYTKGVVYEKNRRNDRHICLNLTDIENQSLPEFFSDNFLRNSSKFKSAKLFQMLDTYTYLVKLDVHLIWGIKYKYIYYRMTKYGRKWSNLIKQEGLYSLFPSLLTFI